MDKIVANHCNCRIWSLNVYINLQMDLAAETYSWNGSFTFGVHKFNVFKSLIVLYT